MGGVISAFLTTHTIVANLADERLWCMLVMVGCAIIALIISATVALFCLPQGKRARFVSRVHSEASVALFASLWSSLMLAAGIFLVFAAGSLLFPFPQCRAVLLLFPLIWCVCYIVMASIWIRRVFREALSTVVSDHKLLE